MFKKHKHKHRVYIPLKPPFPIPSDNTAVRVRVSTPLQTTVSLRLLPPGRYRGPFMKMRRFSGGRRHRFCSSFFWSVSERQTANEKTMMRRKCSVSSPREDMGMSSMEVRSSYAVSFMRLCVLCVLATEGKSKVSRK